MEQNQQSIDQLNRMLYKQRGERKFSIIYSHNSNSTTCSGGIEAVHVLCECSHISENVNTERETNVDLSMRGSVSFESDFRKYL
jgi:hypothetical protein